MEDDEGRSLWDYEAASHLGISTDEVEQIRRQGLIHGERYYFGWWPFGSPKYRYDEEAILTYQEGRPEARETVIEMADAILAQAMESEASEVHLEPDRGGLRVRFRINGVLQPVMAIPLRLEKLLTHRFLVMADVPRPLSLTVAQTGIIRRDWNEHEYRFRLSSVPVLSPRCSTGAKLVIHVPPRSVARTMDELGLSPSQVSQIGTLLTASAPGITLFASPRGEGLGTLIRSALRSVNRPANNLYVLSDAPDLSMGGVVCVTLDPAKGMTAVAAVQAARRQDATLIVFPEITDRETARVAVETAEQGVAVWAGVRVPHFTMNVPPEESAGAIKTRFHGFGVMPERLEKVCVGAIMGRLVRVLCPQCKESLVPTATEMVEIESHGIARPERVYRKAGCETCVGSGYRGRTGVFAIYTQGSPGDDSASFAYHAVARFVAGDTDAAELRGLRVGS